MAPRAFRRLFRIAVLATLLSSVTLALPADASWVRHAYVSGSNDEYFGGADAEVAAYVVTDGNFAPKPERVYPDTAGPIALDADGRLYAAQYGCRVSVFAPNSRRVERTLQIEDSSLCAGGHYYYDDITALAVDPAGHLFVSLYNEYSASSAGSNEPRARRQSRGYACGYVFTCTLAYRPGAHGEASPIQTIDAGVLNHALATDSAGNLYVQEAGNEITVIAHPATHPTRVRSIIPSGLQGAQNPVVDDTGHLYVQVARCTGHACVSGVAVFPDDANGVVAPERLFTLTFEEYLWGIAVDDRVLFMGAGGPTVQAFNRQAQGTVEPNVWSLLAPNPPLPAYLAVGP